jgi:hypothetical protein
LTFRKPAIRIRVRNEGAHYELGDTNVSKPTYTAVFDRKTLLWAVMDNATEDIIAFIPNGKTKIPAAVGECKHCLAVNQDFAKKISAGLNGAKVTLRGDANQCMAQAKKKKRKLPHANETERANERLLLPQVPAAHRLRL